MRGLPVRTLRAAAVLAVFLAAGTAVADQPADSKAADAKAAELKASAEQTAATLLKQFGSAYSARYDGQRRLLFISALDEQSFKETSGMMAAFADAFRATLACKPPEWNITVILPTADDYKPLAPSKDATGFYRSADRTIISIDRGRTLIHEFTHALHDADMTAAKQVHSIWALEGLATLFEASSFTAEGIQPQIDTRLLNVQKSVKAKTAVDLAKLVKMDQDAFMKDAQTCYPQVRYLMLYLHDKGVLRKWYDAYKAGFADDPTGLRAMEKVLGKRAFDIEPDWQEWVGKQKLPWGAGRADQGRLGLEFADETAGVKVVSLVAGGAAEQAGRIKAGDIIEKFNGRDIRSTGDMVAAIRAAGAMQTVNVQLLRVGQRITIAQSMGAAKTGQ